MRRYVRLISIFGVFFFFLAIFSKNAYAVAITCNLQASSAGGDGIYTIPTERVLISASNVLVDGSPAISTSDGDYYLSVSGGSNFTEGQDIPQASLNNGVLNAVDITATLNALAVRQNVGNRNSVRYSVNLFPRGTGGNSVASCVIGVSVIMPTVVSTRCENDSVTFARIDDANVTVRVDGSKTNGFADGGSWSFYAEPIGGGSGTGRLMFGTGPTNGGRAVNGTFTSNEQLPEGQYSIVITGVADQVRYCVINNSTLIVGNPFNSSTYAFNLCSQIPDTTTTSDGQNARTACQNCDGVWTSLGCIATTSTTIIQTVVKIGLSIAGGVALLMIIAAAFMLSTSQGEQKRVTEARELITSAVIGLVFIILSVTMLQFIGVNILQIPGFGG